MKVVARTNRGEGLPEAEQAEFSGPVHTVQPITKGQEYGVYSMVLLAPFLNLDSFGLQYLIFSDFGLPAWVPASLFDVSDSMLSANWQFKRFPPGRRSRWRAVWGYPAMVEIEGHNDSLLEIEKPAQRVFLAGIDRQCVAGRDGEHLLALERALSKH